MNAIADESAVASNISANAKSVEPAVHTSQPHGDVNQQGKKIQELVGRVESWPDKPARDLMQDCIQALLTLHGDALERMLQLIKNAGDAGKEVSDALLRDKHVRGLLLIHGLHPVSLEMRLREALDKVRPYMQSHGGNVELIQLKNDTAKLRLEGTCKSCPSSSVTLELAVRQAVEEACPDLLGFDVEGVVAQETLSDHLPANAPRWTLLDDFAPLADGIMRAQTVNTIPVIFFRCGENLYSYRNVCPACGARLSDGVFSNKTVNCASGHRFNVQRAGVSFDNSESYIEPFPLLAANGVVKISVK